MGRRKSQTGGQGAGTGSLPGGRPPEMQLRGLLRCCEAVFEGEKLACGAARTCERGSKSATDPPDECKPIIASSLPPGPPSMLLPLPPTCRAEGLARSVNLCIPSAHTRVPKICDASVLAIAHVSVTSSCLAPKAPRAAAPNSLANASAVE
eukprot:scaffold253615_cov28-Tisochrysis_lutea.AAC.2